MVFDGVAKSLINKSKVLAHDSNIWIRCVQFDHKFVAFGCLNRSDIMVYEWETQACKRSLRGHTGVIYCLQILAGSVLVSGSGDGVVKVRVYVRVCMYAP